MAFPTFKFEVAWTTPPRTRPGPGAWTDESSYIRAIDCGPSSRENELESMQAGVATIVLDDRTRRFDRLNAAGPLYGNIKPRRRCRVIAQHPSLDRPALDFDGTTGDYASKAAFAGFPTTAFTIEAELTGTGAAAGNNSDETPWSYYVSGAHEVTAFDLKALQVRIIDTVVATNVDVLGDGRFSRHLAVVWRSRDGYLAVFVDGVRRYSTYGIKTGASITAGGTFVLGQEQDSAGGTFNATEALKGKLREVRVWNIARTQHAIAGDRWRTLGGAETGLVSYWKIDAGAGATLTDSKTGNPNPLTIVGAAWATMSGDRPVFTGFIESIKPAYELGNRDAVQVITAADQLSNLARVQPRMSPYRQTILDHGPYLYWPMDEPSGPAVDWSGNGRDGAYIGTDRAVEALFPVGDTGRATHLEPGDVVYALSGATARFDYNVATSMSLMVRFAGSDVTNARVQLVSNMWLGTKGYRWDLRQFGQTVSLVNNDALNNEFNTDGYLVVFDGGWHHVAWTYTGTPSTPNLLVFVDGQVVTWSSGSVLSATIVDAVTNLLTVGPLATGRGDVYDVSHLAIFERVLSPAEVKEQYEAAFRPWRLQRSDVRVAKLLDYVGVPDDDRDLRYGTATVDQVREPIGRVAIEQAQEVARIELGALYADPDGHVVFDDRYATSYDTPLVLTFGDQAGEVGYSSIDPWTDDFDLTTEVRAQRIDGPLYVEASSGAEADYAPRTFEISGPWSDDDQPRDVADIVLAQQTTPTLRFEELAVDQDPPSWADLIRISVNRSRVNVKRRPPGGGAAISQDCVVGSMRWSVRPRNVHLKVGLFPDYGSRSDLHGLGRSPLDGTSVLA